MRFLVNFKEGGGEAGGGYELELKLNGYPKFYTHKFNPHHRRDRKKPQKRGVGGDLVKLTRFNFLFKHKERLINDQSIKRYRK